MSLRVDDPGGSTHPEVAAAVLDAIRRFERDTGLRAYPTSGYRSPARQAALYARFRAGRGGRAAPPGRSAHGLGLAVDVNVAQGGRVINDPRVYQLLARYLPPALRGGFLADDPGHIEYRDWRRYA